eukprot:4194036-Heterocapsa_arctica.AAC.1
MRNSEQEEDLAEEPGRQETRLGGQGLGRCRVARSSRRRAESGEGNRSDESDAMAENDGPQPDGPGHEQHGHDQPGH